MIDGTTYWYTGEQVSLCSHEPLPVYTNGKRDYAYCCICHRTWYLGDGATVAEGGWNEGAAL